MKKLMRISRHLVATRWEVSRCLPQRSLDAITAAIGASELLHMGELRFAVEAGLEWPAVFAGMSSRERALHLFSTLGIWDTEHNSGVLIYLLLADRKVEIIADRGINAVVDDSEWARICGDMEGRFRNGRFEEGVLVGIAAITGLLKQHFPAQGENPNDLTDSPTIL